MVSLEFGEVRVRSEISQNDDEQTSPDKDSTKTSTTKRGQERLANFLCFFFKVFLCSDCYVIFDFMVVSIDGYHGSSFSNVLLFE